MNWWEKPLYELADDEWEQLCDGCGRCCMHKFEDEDTGEVMYTNVSCRLLDCESCRCTDYTHRMERVSECMDIRHFAPEQFQWLPPTCAYRLRFEGKALPDWHPLLAGGSEMITEAGISMRNVCISEGDVKEVGS